MDNRRLSEISHLFLSDVRNVQTGHAPRPSRKPPGSFKGDVSVDLTPEEFAQVFAESAASAGQNQATEDAEITAPSSTIFKPVRAVIAHHLGELMSDRVRDLAGMFAPAGSRVGVIYADSTDIRVCCIETGATAQSDVAIEPMESARLNETVIELNADVSQWLVVLPEPRSAEARDVLKNIHDWVLITGVDHDGIVSSYRTIKGLCESAQPALQVAVFGAVDETEVSKTHRKLAGVCEQFLHVHVGLLGAIEPAGDDVAEHCLLHASTTCGDLPPIHWNLLTQMGTPSEQNQAPVHEPIRRTETVATPASPRVAVQRPQATSQPASALRIESTIDSHAPSTSGAFVCEQVIDLPGADATPLAIIRAVVAGGNDLIETPIKSPASADVMVAVSRDHQLTMLAVARAGLIDLKHISGAFRWMNENRALIGMALPQFALDVHAMPRLELLVDHADITAEALQALVATGHIHVRTYRKLRWGGKTGLLLEAA